MSTKIKSELVKMTPEMAAKILQKNPKNRPISKKVVKRYARIMKEGRWKLNGEAVIITKDDALIDGQHRLEAVVEANIAVPMMLTTGVDPSSYKTVDTGKMRTGADALATHSEIFAKHRTVIAAATKIAFDFKRNGEFEDRRERLEHDELIDYLEKNKGLLRSVEFAATLHNAKRICPQSAMGALHYLFSKKDVALAEKFFDRLNSGENMKKDDPVNVLRNRLWILSQSEGRLRARELLPLLVFTWEKMRNNEKIEKLTVPKDYVVKIV